MSYQTVGVSGFTSFNKIPEYAKEYKRENQFIRGINKEFKYLINKLDNLNNGLFESKLTDRIKYNMKRFLRGQEKGKLKDISNFILPIDEVDNLIYINKLFGYYKLRYDAFCDDDDVKENKYLSGSVSDSDSDDDGYYVNNYIGGRDNDEYLVDGKPYPGFINKGDFCLIGCLNL